MPQISGDDERQSVLVGQVVNKPLAVILAGYGEVIDRLAREAFLPAGAEHNVALVAERFMAVHAGDVVRRLTVKGNSAVPAPYFIAVECGQVIVVAVIPNAAAPSHRVSAVEAVGSNLVGVVSPLRGVPLDQLDDRLSAHPGISVPAHVSVQHIHEACRVAFEPIPWDIGAHSSPSSSRLSCAILPSIVFVLFPMPASLACYFSGSAHGECALKNPATQPSLAGEWRDRLGGHAV